MLPLRLAVCADRWSRQSFRARADAAGCAEFRRHLELGDHDAPRKARAVFKDKPFFTKEEAAAWDREYARRNEEPPPGTKQAGTGLTTRSTVSSARASVKTLRTSIITDPSDGRIPALTPAAADARRRRLEGLKKFENPEDLGLQDQCLACMTARPPMLPTLVQRRLPDRPDSRRGPDPCGKIHDARIVRLDGRPHAPSRIRSWLGDSIGHWDGDTLVVDTTNFNDGGGFYGDAGGNFGWDRNLHLIERLTPLDADTLLYQIRGR